MHLYGQDMDSTTTPLEAGLGWLVHLEMPKPFVGRDALEQQTAAGVQRRLVGLQLQGRAIPRHGYPVLAEGAAPGSQPVGTVTSGWPFYTSDAADDLTRSRSWTPMTL